jgi:hypothetical protein
LEIQRLGPDHGKIRTSPESENSYFVQIKEIKLGRNRTATAVLELRGSTKHNAYRYRDRANEPIVKTKLPDAPRRLPKDVKAAWLEMKSRGGLWLTSADQFLVHIAAFYMARYRNNECSSAETSLLIGVLGKLGFSPKERAALNVTDEKD